MKFDINKHLLFFTGICFYIISFAIDTTFSRLIILMLLFNIGLYLVIDNLIKIILDYYPLNKSVEEKMGLLLGSLIAYAKFGAITHSLVLSGILFILSVVFDFCNEPEKEFNESRVELRIVCNNKDIDSILKHSKIKCCVENNEVIFNYNEYDIKNLKRIPLLYKDYFSSYKVKNRENLYNIDIEKAVKIFIGVVSLTGFSLL